MFHSVYNNLSLVTSVQFAEDEWRLTARETLDSGEVCGMFALLCSAFSLSDLIALGIISWLAVHDLLHQSLLGDETAKLPFITTVGRKLCGSIY